MWMVHRMSFQGWNFVSGLICTLKSNKSYKPKTLKTRKKNFFQKTLDFPALGLILLEQFPEVHFWKSNQPGVTRKK